MRKRSGQVHSRESSATLQLTVSLLYRIFILWLHNKCIYDTLTSFPPVSGIPGRSC